MPANIHGQERSVEKIFSDDYSFSIPLYQRPYSWTDENTRGLLLDLLNARLLPDKKRAQIHTSLAVSSS